MTATSREHSDQASAYGHKPTVLAAFLHFDLSFMIWVLLGALGVSISESLGLSAGQKGLMVAIPILSGSLMRIPLGLLSDRFGGRRVGLAMLLALFIPLLIGWKSGTSLGVLVAVGLMLGVAGASFAVVLPLASRWYPPERQGLVMGIAAAGNSGTVVANLAAPRIAAVVGWHNVLALTMIPLALVLVAFWLLAKDSPMRVTQQSLGSYLVALRQRELWWFCLLYSVTFGGYVGLSSFMPLLLRDQYQLSAVSAGYVTALAALAGSGLRPVGGYVADRIGGVRLLYVLLAGIGAAYIAAARLPSLTVMFIILVAVMVCLGLGNGAVFQLVPQCFRRQIGIATGVVGAVGGLGGFMLPTMLGQFKQRTGSFGAGFMVLGVVAFLSLALLRRLMATDDGWRSSWRESDAGIVLGAQEQAAA
ncbi:MAG TPA: nitrate/nitrite transporter [Gemmatimonadaceae bacterium]|nr:nitrate/nitrite transporter [Gemmatimonadaceae bacterium]